MRMPLGEPLDRLSFVAWRFLMKEIAPGGGLVVEFYGVLIIPKLVDNAQAFYEMFYDLARY